MLTCPVCGSTNYKVLETRNNRDHPGLYRRRICKDCKARWTTYEYAIDIEGVEEFRNKILESPRYQGDDILIG